MACISGPSIIDSGLVLHLDAANTRSYPGTGTTWFDLSGKAHHATMVNSPTYDAINKGFTGFNTNEYLQVGNTPYNNIPYGTQDRTLIIHFKTPTVISGYQHIFHYGTAAGDTAYGLALLSGYLNNHTWAGNSSFSNSALTASKDYIVALRYSNLNTPRNDFFVNDIFGTTSYGQGKSADYAINTGTTDSPRIGTRISAYAEPFGNGIIKSILIYNRVLSNIEIKQNFEATRGRYNV